MDCLSSGLQNGKVRKGSQENIFQHVFLPWIVTGKILCSVATAGKPGYTQNNFRQTTLAELRELPIPSGTPAKQANISELVHGVLLAKHRNPDADTSALEREIDQLVYQLYGLTEEEIKIVEGK